MSPINVMVLLTLIDGGQIDWWQDERESDVGKQSWTCHLIIWLLVCLHYYSLRILVTGGCWEGELDLSFFKIIIWTTLH